MPIQDWSRYPDDWPAIAHAVKDACAWTCQVCGQACRRPGDPSTVHLPTLTVAHWDHLYLEPEIFVVACCATCHLRHDARDNWRRRRTNLRRRQEAAGQRTLISSTPRETGA